MKRRTRLLFALVLLLAALASVARSSPDERTPVAWASCGRQQLDLSYVTDVNAQSANGGLAVGVSDEGRVSVFRWPSPSYYDQVKYFTYSYDVPHKGALPNEGLFFGLALTRDGATRTSWLDAGDWNVTQRFVSPDSDAVETVYTSKDSSLGVGATVTDVVADDADVFRRHVAVTRSADSPVEDVRLVAFENFNLVVSKIPLLPTQDWCQEEENVDTAEYVAADDTILHSKTGVDVSTQTPTSAAVAMGLATASSAHQIGGDAYEPAAAPDARLVAPRQDAFDDAVDGNLQGTSGPYTGQTTGALMTPLTFANGEASAELIVTAATEPAGALAGLRAARATSFARALAAKQQHVETLLARAPLPNTTDQAVLALAKRALITALTVTDRRTGAIVASIATQGPYGEDWPRDGAFINRALDIAGFPQLVRAHNRFYVETQSKPDRPPRGAPPGLVPPGNWNMMYYADGVAGGPVPWEIDETALTLWTFWDHFEQSGDRGALEETWPAIKLGADFLTVCRDPSTGLQCPAIEDDTTTLSQTIHGAGTVWLALDSAARAARLLGHVADATAWEARATELRAAIDQHLFNGAHYGGGSGAGAWMIWPVNYLPYDDARMRAQADYVWGEIAPSFDAPGGSRGGGAYEAKALLALGKIWAGDQQRLARVRTGLEWMAHVQATPGTGVLGESWTVRNGRVVTKISQPHVWEQILFYLASLEAYGRQ